MKFIFLTNIVYCTVEKPPIIPTSLKDKYLEFAILDDILNSIIVASTCAIVAYYGSQFAYKLYKSYGNGGWYDIKSYFPFRGKPKPPKPPSDITPTKTTDITPTKTTDITPTKTTDITTPTKTTDITPTKIESNLTESLSPTVPDTNLTESLSPTVPDTNLTESLSLKLKPLDSDIFGLTSLISPTERANLSSDSKFCFDPTQPMDSLRSPSSTDTNYGELFNQADGLIQKLDLIKTFPRIETIDVETLANLVKLSIKCEHILKLDSNIDIRLNQIINIIGNSYEGQLSANYVNNFLIQFYSAIVQSHVDCTELVNAIFELL